MTDTILDMSTDYAWELWGRYEPYFGVITDEKYKRAALVEQAYLDFFDSGDLHVKFVMDFIQRTMITDFTPESVLDFGCGVGRTLIPFARLAKSVHGSDVSTTMLAEARINCDNHMVTNVNLFKTTDSLEEITGPYDLIHSFIVFQHIPIPRGLTILRNLIAFLKPNGVLALQITYAGMIADASGTVTREIRVESARKPSGMSAAPIMHMQMNHYDLNDVLFILHTNEISIVNLYLTDHGGQLGVFIFGRRHTGLSTISCIT